MSDQKNFVHLHVHSEYSVLDGVIKIDDLVARVKELGMEACALTDHGNLYGAVDFYRKMKEAELKPILGCEAYITDDADFLEKTDMHRDNMHMGLLAMNQTGWQNLLWLVSNANQNNFYYIPRISWDRLAERNEGLIAFSGCLGGVVAKQTRTNRAGEIIFTGSIYDEAGKKFTDPAGVSKQRLHKAACIFDDRFYIEIQHNPDMWEQKAYNQWVIPIALQNEIPLVITSDVHYLRQSDSKVRALVGAQKSKQTIEEYEEEVKKFGAQYYMKTQKEMWDAAYGMLAEEAYENTTKIAEMCNVELTLGEYQNPEFDITSCNDYKEFLEWSKSNE